MSRIETIRLEKVVASKHLRLAVEMEEERRARLENAINIVLILCMINVRVRWCTCSL